MRKIHIVLQGKGGVGKSFVSATLAQYLQTKGETPLCIDTDPINATLCGYKSLNVHKLDLLQNDEINTRNFDMLIELIAESPEEAIIIDNGASTFVPLSHYLLSNDIPALLTEMGCELFIHSVITGGQAQLDTVSGFAQLAKQFKSTPLVVWLNPYWGAIEYEGKGFEQMKAYNANQSCVAAIIRIPELKAETFGQDLAEILKERITFEEALAQTDKPIVVRQRLKIIQSKLFDQLDAAKVI